MQVTQYVFRMLLYVSAFVAAFYRFYLLPMFFHNDDTMKVFELVPRMKPLGIDLFQTLSFITGWINNNATQFDLGNLYPPMATLLLAPLSLYEFKTAYYLISFASFISVVFIIMIFPYLMTKKKEIFIISAPVLLVTLFTYPFLFEIERGQFNLIAICLTLLAVWIYHDKLKSNYAAFVAFGLFTIAIQLKVYPALFIFTFVKKGQSIKCFIKKMLLLFLLNFLLLFVLGFDKFKHFFKAIEIRGMGNKFVSEVNASIFSYFTIFKRVMGEKFSGNSDELIEFVLNFAVILHILTYIILGIGLIYMLYNICKQKIDGKNSYLLMIISLLVILLPQTSHDYKLAILGAPLVLLLGENILPFIKGKLGFAVEGLVFFITYFYCTTLWHFWEHKQNTMIFKINTVALFGMYVLTFLIFIISQRKNKSTISSHG